MRGARESGEAAPRCLRCAYTLEGLIRQGPCPECGALYDLDDPWTFTILPPFVRWKFWLPGLAMSVGAGLALYAVLWSALGVSNWPLWLGVGVAVGCILGYRARAPWWTIPALAAVALGALLIGLLGLGIAGVFCVLMLGLVLVGPVLGGAALGASLRHALKRSRFSQRSYLPVVAFIAMPVVAAALAGRPAAPGVETIRTSEVVEASAQQCWDALQFYEEVEHPAPLLLRLTLPRPLRTMGRATQPGDTKTCVYTTGNLVKLVTEAEAPRSLRFVVIEQSLGIDREVRLVGGAFDFTGAEGGTRVTLTTTYEPQLTPRWSWRPAERLAVRTLHRHVIDGIRRECEGASQVARAGAAP